MIDWSGGHWSAGTYGFWIVLGVCFIWLVLNAFFGWLLISEGDADGELWFGFWSSVVVMLVTVGITVGAYWPLDSTFHKWYPVRGTVAESQNRILTNGDGGVSQRYVLRIRETGQLFGVDDTRASLLKPGDSVSLKCKKEWQFQADAGWACRWSK